MNTATALSTLPCGAAVAIADRRSRQRRPCCSKALPARNDWRAPQRPLSPAAPGAAHAKNLIARKPARSTATYFAERSIDMSEHIADPYGFVSDVMTAPVVTLTPETPVTDALDLLDQGYFTGLPVVDEDGHCIGVLSEKDVAWCKDILDEGSPEDIAELQYHSVGDFMTAPAITIKEHAHIAFAAGTMIMHKLHRLPVVDDDDKVIGIVTKVDTFQPIRSIFLGGDPLYRTMPNTESPYYGLCFTGSYL